MTKFFLCGTYLSKRGVKSDQLRSSDVFADNLSQNKNTASKMAHRVSLEQMIRMICKIKHLGHHVTLSVFKKYLTF